MRILISGATGFIGRKLIDELIRQDYHDIAILSTRPDSISMNQVEVFPWNPMKGEIDVRCLDGVDVVINLAGESIASSRWSTERKERILQSRVRATKLLVDKIRGSGANPKKFISASAIGVYGNRGDELLDEKSSSGNGFLAEVCKRWELAALEQNIESMKAIIIRIGLVLDGNGGALEKMVRPFKLGLGGKLGSGNQYMSWIHLDDLVKIFIWAMQTPGVDGIYNGVAPHPVTNEEFTVKFGEAMRRPTILPVPSLALKLALGEMSSLLLEGQRVLPDRLIKSGFQFNYDQLDLCLRDICNSKCF